MFSYEKGSKNSLDWFLDRCRAIPLWLLGGQFLCLDAAIVAIVLCVETVAWAEIYWLVYIVSIWFASMQHKWN